MNESEPAPFKGQTPGKMSAKIPFAAMVLAGIVLICWLGRDPYQHLSVRNPGGDRALGGDGAASTNAVLSGKLLKGEGVPSALSGSWAGFRGNTRDGIAQGTGLQKLLATPEHPSLATAASAVAKPGVLARSWGAAGPPELWRIDLGEGYAGPAIVNGRVYLMDYDREKKQDVLRCLSLSDGKLIWQFGYPVAVKRNHGMSRTVPAVGGQFVVAMGPKCHVVCLDSTSGELRWGMDLVRQFGTTVPAWYAGQCPLIDEETVILAPGGKDALLIKVELATGRVIWKTPNPKGWKMTHSSIMPMEFGGQRFYIYCASLGVVGVSAKDGALLWDTSDWKISIATVPSPVILDSGRIFFSGGYNAGSLMLQLAQSGDRIVPKPSFRLDAESFGATQQTPIWYEGHLYGVRADGQFVSLDPQGKTKWSSGPGHTFGLGSFLCADGMIYVLNDSGLLSLLEASPTQFNLLAQAQVLKGHESWAPMALVNGRLLARDLTRMVCLDVAQH